MDITWFGKMFPRLTRFILGDACPKCETLMTMYYVNYTQCPNCGYKRYKDMVV